MNKLTIPELKHKLLETFLHHIADRDVSSFIFSGDTSMPDTLRIAITFEPSIVGKVMHSITKEQLELLLHLVIKEKQTICGDAEYAELCATQRKLEELLNAGVA